MNDQNQTVQACVQIHWKWVKKISSKVETCPMKPTNYNTHKDLQIIDCDYWQRPKTCKFLENYKILQDTILKPEKEDMCGKTSTYSNHNIAPVTDEWMITEHWWNNTDREKPEYSKKNLPCYFFHHKYGLVWEWIRAFAVTSQWLTPRGGDDFPFWGYPCNLVMWLKCCRFPGLFPILWTSRVLFLIKFYTKIIS